MDSVKKNSDSSKNIFMRLINWIAKGAATAQAGKEQCPT
jgi:hypothetical protein